MENIVVGVDDRAASRAALAWVGHRCAAHAAEVELVHVVGEVSGRRKATADLRAEAEHILHEAAPGQAVRFHRAEGGVARTLGELSADADLLVIGVDPAHPLRAALGGWLPVRVIARSVPPVCIVPAGWVPREGSVTVGVDEDSSSAEALEFAAKEAGETSRRLRVVHAWHLPEPALDGSAALLVRPDRVLQEHRDLLDAATQSLQRRFPDLHIESDLVRSHSAEALLDHAPNATMIVIGTHREGVLVGGYTGSVAQDMLWRAGCPIVVVPPAGFPPKGAQR
ncbi:universal stress protein [Microbacterium testaceum]|uniref:universal stress protein n=1 Tax=Microbacterium testaceum TaxID=2033 RepID=UPI001D176CA9|nr:universal stress protein [Microbacterium testaceum]MCC4248295.1 universal stress protein [Microbacterium testaceum]